MKFQLPQACYPDSLLVYPVLSEKLQEEWNILEGARVNGELTTKVSLLVCGTYQQRDICKRWRNGLAKWTRVISNFHPSFSFFITPEFSPVVNVWKRVEFSCPLFVSCVERTLLSFLDNIDNLFKFWRARNSVDVTAFPVKYSWLRPGFLSKKLSLPLGGVMKHRKTPTRCSPTLLVNTKFQIISWRLQLFVICCLLPLTFCHANTNLFLVC